MPEIGTTYHILARLAAAIAVVIVVLAGISRLIGQSLVFEISSYMTIATVAILFAIYFVVEGWADAAKKAK